MCCNHHCALYTLSPCKDNTFPEETANLSGTCMVPESRYPIYSSNSAEDFSVDFAVKAWFDESGLPRVPGVRDIGNSIQEQVASRYGGTDITRDLILLRRHCGVGGLHHFLTLIEKVDSRQRLDIVMRDCGILPTR